MVVIFILSLRETALIYVTITKHFHNIVKFICVGIMAMDKITTHIFKFLYKSITTHYGGGGGVVAYEYIQKIGKLIPTHAYICTSPM